ncbi:MAG TPA: hypothetical protein VFO77_09060 [Actinoplanes sp.]|nr:hypothetical protein [Actinoplanes sp.]
MRVFRTILGMLLLTIGLSALLAGAGLWTTMQHRDAGGAFTATLQNVATPGYAVVVDDLDALLDADASFVRVGDTRLRLTARTASGPAFIGIAPAGEVARYLDGVSHAAVDGVDIGTGALPVRSTRVAGSRAPGDLPSQQGFWQAGDLGQLDLRPAQLRDRDVSLVIMNADAQPGMRLQATAEVRPGWLNTAAWASLLLGSILIFLGMMALAWPSRRRELVFVVDPSQVPELAKRMGAPLAIGSGPAGHTGSHRPRTLADANSASATWPTLNPPPAPQLTWPPAQGGSTEAGAAPDRPAGAPSAIALGGAPVEPPPAAAPNTASTASRTTASTAGTAAATDLKEGPADLSKVAAAGSPAPAPKAGARPLGERDARHRPVGERQEFEAAAVEAWVAETSAARARDVQARAAAVLATEDHTPAGTPKPAVTPAAPAAVTTDTKSAAAKQAPASAKPVAAPAPAKPVAAPAAAKPAPAAKRAASTAPAAGSPDAVFDKPFEPTLTKAAVSKAGLSKVPPAPLPPGEDDDEPAATLPAGRASGAADRRRARRLSEDLAAAAEAALAGSSSASRILDTGTSSAKTPIAKTAVPKPATARPKAAEAASKPAEAAPKTSAAASKASAGAKPESAPIGEQRKQPASGAQPAPGTVADGARADSTVPTARTAAELQPASAAPAAAGRRRKAVEPAEQAGKTTRATRRSTPVRQPDKG